jgi:hypothetical protein
MTTPLVGAGTSGAGAGPSGADPVGEYSTPGIIKPPAGEMVAKFDLATHSVPRDVNGLVERIHWVDQAVALALGVTNGKLTSQSSLGNKLRLIKRNSPLRLDAEVKDAVRVALFNLIDRRDIVVTDVQISQPARSQILVRVWYVNTHLSPASSLPDNIAFLF